MALYRIWRPLIFSDVYGQNHITETLLSQVIGDRVSHAYIFTGSRGTGKTTCAKILSRAVNCLSPINGNPCNKCSICIGILDGSILDVIEIDAASNNGVDNIRDLREQVRYAPANTKNRVYIIDEVHMLSTGAFNALLKTLEEPPKNTIFILATTEINKVPATILSRCQRFDFRRIKHSDICDRLRIIAIKENLELTDAASELISELANGGMRDALSILDRCITENKTIDESLVRDCVGIITNEDVYYLLNTIIDLDIENAIMSLENWYNKGSDIMQIVNQLLDLIRDILLFKISNNQSYIQNIKDISEKIEIPTLLVYMDILTKSSKLNKRDVEILLIKLCTINTLVNNTVSFDNISEKNIAVKNISQKIKKPIAEIQNNESDTQKTDFNNKNIENKANVWEELLKSLKNKVSKSTFNCMSISANGYFDGNMLKINTDDDITALLISKDKDIINKAASEICGKNISLKVIEKSIISSVDDIIDRAKSFTIEIKDI